MMPQNIKCPAQNSCSPNLVNPECIIYGGVFEKRSKDKDKAHHKINVDGWKLRGNNESGSNVYHFNNKIRSIEVEEIVAISSMVRLRTFYVRYPWQS